MKAQQASCPICGRVMDPVLCVPMPSLELRASWAVVIAFASGERGQAMFCGRASCARKASGALKVGVSGGQLRSDRVRRRREAPVWTPEQEAQLRRHMID